VSSSLAVLVSTVGKSPVLTANTLVHKAVGVFADPVVVFDASP